MAEQLCAGFHAAAAADKDAAAAAELWAAAVRTTHWLYLGLASSWLLQLEVAHTPRAVALQAELEAAVSAVADAMVSASPRRLDVHS